jgi:hypothetical protein
MLPPNAAYTERRAPQICVSSPAMTDARRSLGNGPDPEPFGSNRRVQAAEADLGDLPGVRLPDLNALRARGVLGAPPLAPGRGRRRLGLRD